MPEEILRVSDETFNKEVLQSDGAVLVDFWAVWCGPCRMIAPTLEFLAREYKGKLKVVKVNVDESPKIPSRYGVMSIPTLLLFKGGEVAETIVGALPQDKIVEILSRHL